MGPGILSAGIENGGHWRWPSRSFLPFWIRILGNSACPCNYPSQIWARITKFAPNMLPGILSTGIENGGHWPWPLRSLWPFWLRILENSAGQQDNSSQIGARITKICTKHASWDTFGWYWKWRSLNLTFKIIFTILTCVITCNGFELDSPNLHQICILWCSWLLLKIEVIGLELQGHLTIIPIQETAFNVALVYWSRPAYGCYMSQTCSCGSLPRTCKSINVV